MVEKRCSCSSTFYTYYNIQHVPFFSGGLSVQPFEEDGLGRAIEKEEGVLQYRHIVSNAEAVLAILKNHNYPLALAGHYHSSKNFLLRDARQDLNKLQP
jgi:hypothetical protein